MVNIIACLFIADVVLVFATYVIIIIRLLYKLVSGRYKNMLAPSTMSSPLKVKSKITGEIFDVYDTRHEEDDVGFMIYKKKEFKWVSATEFEPTDK